MEECGSWGCSWTGNYFVFCSSFTNNVQPSCLTDLGQIFIWGFRSPYSHSVMLRANVHRIQLLWILVTLWLSCVSVSVSVSSGNISEAERLLFSCHILFGFAAHLAVVTYTLWLTTLHLHSIYQVASNSKIYRFIFLSFSLPSPLICLSWSFCRTTIDCLNKMERRSFVAFCPRL